MSCRHGSLVSGAPVIWLDGMPPPGLGLQWTAGPALPQRASVSADIALAQCPPRLLFALCWPLPFCLHPTPAHPLRARPDWTISSRLKNLRWLPASYRQEREVLSMAPRARPKVSLPPLPVPLTARTHSAGASHRPADPPCLPRPRALPRRVPLPLLLFHVCLVTRPSSHILQKPVLDFSSRFLSWESHSPSLSLGSCACHCSETSPWPPASSLATWLDRQR